MWKDPCSCRSFITAKVDNCIDGLTKAFADYDLCSGGSVDENVYNSFRSD